MFKMGVEGSYKNRIIIAEHWKHLLFFSLEHYVLYKWWNSIYLRLFEAYETWRNTYDEEKNTKWNANLEYIYVKNTHKINSSQDGRIKESSPLILEFQNIYTATFSSMIWIKSKTTTHQIPIFTPL